MKAYIHCIDGVPAFDFAMACYEGASKRGMEIVKFENINEVPANRNNLVVTCIEDTLSYLERLGIDTPYALDAFELFSGTNFIKRKNYVTELEDLMPKTGRIGIYKFGNNPFFMKPLKETKAFASGVVSNAANLPFMLCDYKGPRSIEVRVSEVVDMVSEYRVFVRPRAYNDKIIAGMKHYQGDPFIVPERGYIIDAINHLVKYTDFPHAYSLDVAVLADGRTEIVELNDAWSCGSYGLDGQSYISFYIDRWVQLMSTKYVQPEH